ncbi:MAG: hypothetical protein K5766_01850 [Alphaproteobacteria bacterium]|nr:hypothetical protein [Alphaproteobacteria bacterium]
MKNFIKILRLLLMMVLCSCNDKIQEDLRIPAMVCVEGPFLEDKEIELLQKYRPVGVLLFGENCDNEAQVIKLTKQLKSLGFLVAVDIEGKGVNRFKKFHPLEKDAIDFRNASLKEIYDYYFDVAQYAKKLGIDIIFGPVTDVCDKADSFIVQRCFSGNSGRVSKCASAVVRAYQDAGIFPVIKHLPGHGKAVDSHKQLPTVSASKSELYNCDILASKAVITSLKTEARSLPGGMVAHVVYKNIDPEFPGTLSKTIIQKVIRNDIGMKDCIIFSDAMGMNALVDFVYQNNLAEKKNYQSVALTKFLEAGGDIAILDSIKSLEENKGSFPKRSNIMLRIQKAMKIRKAHV